VTRAWSVVAVAITVAVVGCGQESAMSRQSRDREVFVQRLAEREGLLDVWHLMSRADLVFDEGVSKLAFVDPGTLDRAWNAAPGPLVSSRGQPVRWMGPRTLLKVRSDGDARLEIVGRVDVQKSFTRPRVTVTFDGVELHSALTAADGSFEMAADVPAAEPGRWADVYITLSSVSEPWRDPASLQIARLERVVWRPRDRR
jgi:hypothetical protein